MIEIIRIKNIALIEEVEISFGQGLNILSGETGAGKSIIIDSIGFLLGQKPSSSDFIRTGETVAEVEGLFSIENKEVLDILTQMGVNIGEDNLLVIHRIINKTGKASTRINGKIVAIGQLREISELLIDIHSQHEHQTLLNPLKHIDILDRFCTEDLVNLKEKLGKINRLYKNTLKTIESLIIDERERASKIDLYSFQIEEISKSELKPSEEDELLERKKLISSSEKLSSSTKRAIELLYDTGEGELSALDKILEALGHINEINRLDLSKKSIYDRLYNVETELQEIIRELRSYDNELYFDPKELNEIEQRLSNIYNLKRKYGNSVLEILSYLEEITNKLELINNSEEELKKLEDYKNYLYEEGIILCRKISDLRRKQAITLEKDIKTVLQELSMEEADFHIQIMEQDKFNQNGFDKVEFLISPNRGENLKPLTKIASGGEMSRVMLALKSVLAKAFNLETFIFDEIDTGVSGRTAQKVAKRLDLLSKKVQILSITHLPQIASMADEHFLIEKRSYENKTITNIYKLDQKESVKEIARLIGGEEITEKTIKAASEMISMAKGK